jgi:hypothetical protein
MLQETKSVTFQKAEFFKPIRLQVLKTFNYYRVLLVQLEKQIHMWVDNIKMVLEKY